jgi:hypothetical protein
MTVGCHGNVHEDHQTPRSHGNVRANARPGSFPLLTNPEKHNATMSEVDKATAFPPRHVDSSSVAGSIAAASTKFAV